MKRKSPTIALLADYLICSYQVALVQAVDQATKARDISLLTFAGRRLADPKPDWATQSRIYELPSPDAVDGVLLLSAPIAMHIGPAKLTEFGRKFQPLPVCSIGFELPGIPSLIVSNRQGTRAAVEHLIIHHGARRIAYIRGPSDNEEAAERYQGYLDALMQHGLPIDEGLVAAGEFNVATGARAARELLRRGVEFDALAAGNDYMALAACEVLSEAGHRIPEDVRVVGFDDAPYARYALPPLTTVRQPLERLGRLAVDWIDSALHGKTLPEKMTVDVDLVARASCGCGRFERSRVQSSGGRRTIVELRRRVVEDRQALVQLLEDRISIPSEALGHWAQRLTNALGVELSGTPGCLLAELGSILTEASAHSDYIDELVKAVTLLRFELQRYDPDCEAELELEQLWSVAQGVVSTAATNAQGRQGLAMTVVLEAINNGFAGVVTAMDRETLRDATAAMLPHVNIQNASIGLFETKSADALVPFLTFGAGSVAEPNGARAFPTNQLVPNGFFPRDRHSHVVMALSFEEEWFGLFVCEYSTHEAVYGLLRDNVSASLKSCSLHREALQQSALREQFERQHLETEARLAARIQTAILPRNTRVGGLEIAAQMHPAVNGGGDYYDILPDNHGCWLGIGDVTGHGLVSGLIMMMIQAIVVSLVRTNPALPPSRHLVALNSVLHDNLRNRLELNDYATFTLIRYDHDGTLTFAGAHEELIVYRARSRRCECIEVPGAWIGAIADLAAVTTDFTTRLEPDDLLVLHTDGVTEAMNAHGELFGLARLCATIESLASCEVSAIVKGISEAVGHWHVTQQDDVTVVVARYIGFEERP